MLIDTTPEEFTEDYLIEMRAFQPMPDKEQEEDVEEAESENKTDIRQSGRSVLTPLDYF